MPETRRLLVAAAALSQELHNADVPHAIYGNIFTAVLVNSTQANVRSQPKHHANDYTWVQEMYCIVQGGSVHPFKRVRQALDGNDSFTATHSAWTNRLIVRYSQTIPSIEIEILVAGEFGPRHLDSTTTTRIQGIPFLSISEFIRAKLKSWMIRGLDLDAEDISFVLIRYWNRVDFNRIPEHDMNQFVSRYEGASQAWSAVKNKYGA